MTVNWPVPAGLHSSRPRCRTALADRRIDCPVAVDSDYGAEITFLDAGAQAYAFTFG
jgi:hypothetical protein